jgi:hypothetical protein
MSRRLSHNPNDVVLEEPAYRGSMGLIPHVYTLLLGHLRALIQLGMTPVAQGRYPVVMGLEAPALAVNQLVRVSRYHRAVAHPAVLTRAISHCF